MTVMCYGKFMSLAQNHLDLRLLHLDGRCDFSLRSGLSRTHKYGEGGSQEKIAHGAKNTKAGQAWLGLISVVRKAYFNVPPAPTCHRRLC